MIESKHAEDGFTLVELVIVVAILGILLVAITAGFVTGFRVVDDTNERLIESHDAQLSAAYFANDVQSAVTIEPTDFSAYGACAGPNVILALEGQDFGGPNEINLHVALYSHQATRLVRTYCVKPSGAASFTPQGDAIDVASHVTDADVVPPTGPNEATIQITDVSGYRWELRGKQRPQ